MIELFFRLTVKRTVLRNNLFFSTCCGGLLYGSAVYKIRREPHSLNNRSYSTGGFKILKTVGELFR
jgi:hypothetical protein